MLSEGSITQWIGGLKAGDEEAAQKVWERYFDRLARSARARLRAARPGEAAQDEEDVALSALNSVCLGAARGQFPRLADRDELWGLLIVVAARKVSNMARARRQQKRGGGRVRAEADLEQGGHDEEAAMARVVGREPSPEFAATVAESLRERLGGLATETLRQVALLRLEGYTNEEVAARLGCAARTVERKIQVIRRHWESEES